MFKQLENRADRVCRFCKNFPFCCTKCRDRHVDKEHPGLNINCSLCASEVLPIRQFDFNKLDLEDAKLLCHIIDKHLPLHCKLCGDLFESIEDFKDFGACKSRHWNPLTSPMGLEYVEKKLKQCSMSESDCNGSRFRTPPEIYRNTSTPMLVDQKANFETPCVPNFSLKPPMTNSPLIGQSNVISKIQESQNSETHNTEYFSFSVFSNEETTPFRTGKDENFPRSNSGRKLDVMEERDETAEDQLLSPMDMDLTDPMGGIWQNTPKSDIISEESDRTPDIVKKVRFSDEHETVSQFDNLMESCMKTILNMSAEDEEFHDAYDTSNIRNAKNTEDTKDIKDSLDTKDTENIEDIKNIKDIQVVDRRHSVLKPLENSLNDSRIKIILENTKNEKKEYSEVNNGCLSVAVQQNSNRMLMIVLMENNSEGLNTDLMPLISSGLKKMQEQLASTSSQPSSSMAESLNTANIRRKSVTKMKMSVESVESVESYSSRKLDIMEEQDETADGQLLSPVNMDLTDPIGDLLQNSPRETVDNVITNHREAVSSSSSTVQNNENNGFLSVVAQAMKNALRNFSISDLKIPLSNETTEVVQRQEIVEESSQGSTDVSSFNLASNIQARSCKRAREITEVSSQVDSVSLAMDVRSPLAKRHTGWYKMVRARQPISRMRNDRVRTSPRGVSTETQVFRQGSLMVGDTVLPLPTRAHQSTQTESSLFDEK